MVGLHVFGDGQAGQKVQRKLRFVRRLQITFQTHLRVSFLLQCEHKNHKGREYASYTIAGRVSIGGKEGVVAVVVKKTTGNFYKVHRVLTPNGENLDIKKDTD